MGVNRSGFCKCLSRLRRPSERARQRAGAIKLVLETHAAHPSHGYRRINAKIRLDTGLIMSDEYVRRCCNYVGVVSESHHCGRKAPGEGRRTYPNLLFASMAIDGPMRVVVSDTAPFWAGGKYWEPALCMDLWNDEIVGWSLSSKKGDPSTHAEGLAMFLERKKEKRMGPEAMFHTDQGAVYSSKGFNELLQPYDTAGSMSRR